MTTGHRLLGTLVFSAACLLNPVPARAQAGSPDPATAKLAKLGNRCETGNKCPKVWVTSVDGVELRGIVRSVGAAGYVRFMEDGDRPVTTSAHGVSFMLPVADGVSKAGPIPAVHPWRLATVLPRVEGGSIRKATPARQVVPKRKRPGLGAAVGAVAGAGLGAIYARAGHPGLPHAGGDAPDEVLYIPLFAGISALVGAMLGNR